MFKKVQLRFVAITMSIMLAIFVAVLGSINVIMQTIAQRQSKVILSKIAVNIKYDEKTSMFTFIPDDNFKPEKKEEKWTLSPAETSKNESHSEIITKESSENIKEEVQTTESDSETEKNNEISEDNSISESESEAESKSETESSPEQHDDFIESENFENPDSVYNEPPVPEYTLPEQQPDEKPDYHKRPDDFNFPDRPDKPDYNPDDWPHNDRPDYTPDDNPDNFSPPFNFNDRYYRDNLYNTENLSFDNPVSINNYNIIELSQPEFIDFPDEQRKHLDDIPPKKIDYIDYFVLMADNSGKFLAKFNNEDIEDETAQNYINSILNDGAVTGMINSLQFYKDKKYNGTIFVFTDKSSEIEMLNKLMKTTLLIGSISFVCLSVLVIFLSKKSIEPVQKAFEKQKQFISDASHELKTPLTIISTNADVLAGEIGSNKWLKYIQTQAERMSLLVNDLLNLTRLENNSADMTFSEFNLSQAVINTALPFECQAFESNKIFDIDVDENIMLIASERQCKQLFAIFIDNAIKHSDENGKIKVTLKKSGDKKIFSVYNTGSGIRDDEKYKIFERFYRSDDSRSRSTGGYGLGLAIAKSIIDYHKFKLNVDNCQGKYIQFTIIM
ncbi:MAG: GHKL domain-containing protein [Oscillospiraceae bacterium]|nr:GHKL domain-containing protein [Oscillospiraceae bacterium]